MNLVAAVPKTALQVLRLVSFLLRSLAVALEVSALGIPLAA